MDTLTDGIPVEATHEPWLVAYLEGATLEEAAQLVGVKRQAIDQRLRKKGIPTRSAAETHALKLQKTLELHGSAIREAFLGQRDVAEVAATFELPEAATTWVLERVVPDHDVLAMAPRNLSKRYSEDELLEYLREAASGVPAPLTTKAYAAFLQLHPKLDDGRARPTAQAMLLRFRSWGTALAKAGLSYNPHAGPPKKYNDPQAAIGYIVECWRDLQHPPTASLYDQWQRGKSGRPSSATLRRVTGGWTAGMVKAWQVIHGIELDQQDDDLRLPSDLVPSTDPISYQRADESASIEPSLGLYLKDYLLQERALGSHARIQNAIADAVGALGIRPLTPGPSGVQFDIAFRHGSCPFVVIEVKSCTLLNQELQLRLGLGQVLRYAHQLRASYGDVLPVLATELALDPEWREVLAHSGVELIQEPTLVTDVQRIALLSSGDGQIKTALPTSRAAATTVA